jgi:hypothetical protein
MVADHSRQLFPRNSKGWSPESKLNIFRANTARIAEARQTSMRVERVPLTVLILDFVRLFGFIAVL